MSKINIAFNGCGFIASHIIPSIIPHASRFVLIDRELVEKENYNNSLLPKGYATRRKVTALGSLLQSMTSTPTTMIHENIKTIKDLIDIQEQYNIDFSFVTFDNINARQIAKDCAIQSNIPALFVGVTESYIYIDWAENLVLPTTNDEIKLVQDEIKRIRDVCTRLEFRSLGTIASGYAYFAFTRWLLTNEKNMFSISVKDTIRASNLKR